MEFLPPDIERYSTTHTSPEPEVLQRLNRETHAKILMPRMLSGHLQGRFLSMISHMIAPQRILEIGTYTGYSAICMAEGLKSGGKLYTIDVNEELEEMVRKYINESGNKDTIEFYIGNAVQLVPKMNEVFDLIFIDADKENYSSYFDLVIDKVRQGGFIIADNVLWSGKVILNNDKLDKDTKAIRHFNEKVHHDNRVENVLLPVRDGLMILRKK